MSGGSFDYGYCRVEDLYKGKMEDPQLNELLDDFIKLLFELEWYKSGDTCEEDYRAEVKRFKDKWLKR